jgi:hypothetical protein
MKQKKQTTTQITTLNPKTKNYPNEQRVARDIARATSLYHADFFSTERAAHVRESLP